MKEQATEYLEAAANAGKMIEKMAKKIEDKDRERKELEDKHGITELKTEIRDLKEEMRLTAFGIIGKASAAQQGRLFEDAKEEE